MARKVNRLRLVAVQSVVVFIGLLAIGCGGPAPPVHIVQTEVNRIPGELHDQVQVANGRSVAPFLDGRNMTWTFPDGGTITGMKAIEIVGFTDSPDDPSAPLESSQFVFVWPNSSREQAVEHATPVLEELGLEAEPFLTDTLEAQREGSPFIATSIRQEDNFDLYARIQLGGKDRNGDDIVQFHVILYPLED